MDERSAEEAAHALDRAIVARDYGATIRAMTPDALARAMALGNTTWNCTTYELSPRGQDGDTYVFDVVFQTDQAPLSLRQRLRLVDGVWRIVDIETIP